jgi:hypothetical protein
LGKIGQVVYENLLFGITIEAHHDIFLLRSSAGDTPTPSSKIDSFLSLTVDRAEFSPRVVLPDVFRLQFKTRSNEHLRMATQDYKSEEADGYTRMAIVSVSRQLLGRWF